MPGPGEVPGRGGVRCERPRESGDRGERYAHDGLARSRAGPPNPAAAQLPAQLMSLYKSCQAWNHTAMATMNVSLPEELADYVALKVEEGTYGSASEVFWDALRLMRAQDTERLVRLRAEVRKGLAALDAGPAHEMSDEMFDVVVAAGRRSLTS
jgi:putative addiction module CopG family antidote